MFRKKDTAEKAISTTANNGRGCLIAFGLVFAIVGAGIMHFLFFVPVSRWALAKSWEEVPCTILSSSVGVHDGDDGDTYSIDITYNYEYEGRTWRGFRYSFAIGSSSGRDGKQRVVDQYPPGSKQICYVNPSSPDESVLTVTFQWSYLVGLFGGIFLAVGLFIMLGRMPGMGVGARKTWRDVAARQYGIEEGALDSGSAGSITLKPAWGRWQKLFFTVLFVGIWDGISSVLVYKAIEEGGFGMLQVFALIFGGIGALILLLIPYQILAMFNPRPEITITPGIIPLGATVQLVWRFTGGTQRLQKMEITLVGVEEATYRQGTDTRTARSTFFNQEIAATDNPMDMQEGMVQFTVPEDTMHTFEADNNKIKWSIKLKGDIPHWPNIDEEFPIIVRPMRING